MNNLKYQNIAVLESTKDDCDLYTLLSEGVSNTREVQEIIRKDEPLEAIVPSDEGAATVVVSDKDCVKAAEAYREKKTMVVNFGDAFVQGGGAATGESDQESELCRVSTLYRCLAWKDLWKEYYQVNRDKKPLIHDMIYSPDIIVFKSEADPSQLLPDEEWFKTDVLTAPVPDAAEIGLGPCQPKIPEFSEEETERFTQEDIEERLYKSFSEALKEAKENDIRFLIIPKKTKTCPADKKTIETVLKKAVSEHGNWFVIPGKHDSDFVETLSEEIKELLYEKLHRNITAVLKEEKQVVLPPVIS